MQLDQESEEDNKFTPQLEMLKMLFMKMYILNLQQQLLILQDILLAQQS
ncbi:MAG: hypothetical protein ACKO96_24775 [Flammeovirgaceae bacterium]